jgi:hypothetical protein
MCVRCTVRGEQNASFDSPHGSVVCRTDASAPPEDAISVIAVPKPARGIVVERLSDSMGHRAHLTPRMSVRHFRFASESGNRHCAYALFCCWFISFPSAASNGPCQPSPNDGALTGFRRTVTGGGGC